MQLKNRTRAAAAATLVAVSVGLAGPALAAGDKPAPTPPGKAEQAHKGKAKGWANVTVGELKERLNKVFDKRVTGLDKVLARVAANEKMPAATKEKIVQKVTERKAALAKAKDAVAKAKTTEELRKAAREALMGKKGVKGAGPDAAKVRDGLRQRLGTHEVKPGDRAGKGTVKRGEWSRPGEGHARKGAPSKDGMKKDGMKRDGKRASWFGRGDAAKPGKNAKGAAKPNVGQKKAPSQ